MAAAHAHEHRAVRAGVCHGLRPVAREVLALYHEALSDLQVEVEFLVESNCAWHDMVTSRFRAALIAEDWLVTDLAERLLLAKKR